jgi:cytidylate kinase
MAKRDNISVVEALKVIRNRDDENKRIYKKIYGPQFGENLLVFDVMLNTELFTLDSLIYLSQEIFKKKIQDKSR